jgi:signal transduction histidine kinase/DNA-binding NarL/FixJ family response regulator
MTRTTVRVLLLEDNEAEARLLVESLADAEGTVCFQVVCVDSVESALRSAAETPFGVLLLDLSLPDSSGIETVERILSRIRPIPVVVLTGNDNEETGLEAMRRGAQDYLVKGQTDTKTLVRAIHYAIERKKTEQELMAAREHLEAQVQNRTAELTKTNRMLREEITERVKAEMALSKRQQVLESIYAIETTFSDPLEATYDQIIVTISNIIAVPFAAFCQIEKGKLKTVSQFHNGIFSNDTGISLAHHPCGIVYKERRKCQFSGDLTEQFPEQLSLSRDVFKTYVGVPIMNKEGDVFGMICAMDIRERVFDDYEMHLIEIFARYVGHEIERENMQAQINASREMNLLGRLAFGVAHEVRNPLNALLAISEALFQNIGGTPEYQPYLEHIRNQVNRLSALMKDLLDLGRPLSRSEFRTISLDKLIESVIDTWKISSEHTTHQVSIERDPRQHSIYVKGDAVKIQQAFLNLLENACDHSPGHSKVVIKLLKPDEWQVIVKIIDSGAGISADLLDRVFEPFFTTRKGGTGLGLTIVRNIIEIHGGSIALQNNAPAPGLTVDVRLPLAFGLEEEEVAPFHEVTAAARGGN